MLVVEELVRAIEASMWSVSLLWFGLDWFTTVFELLK